LKKAVSGVYAAIYTPRKKNGGLDENSFRKLIEFLLGRGIRGFVINGATGEYCLTTNNELKRLLRAAKEVINDSADLLAGIGSAGIHGCLDHGKLAMDYGVSCVLLPMPHFFPYAQEDLKAFCGKVAEKLPINILLYNLPQFTTGLESVTVQELITTYPNITGIKDSSGSLEILRDLTKNNIGSCRIVGNDSVLAGSLCENISDGVISGVASVLPDLILSLYELRNNTDTEKFRNSATLLDEFINHLDSVPAPWGLKIVIESLGIIKSSFSQPLSNQRMEQFNHMKDWFGKWKIANF
jgi:4-hydroxy-tetrahydrodipicolinate synthase